MIQKLLDLIKDKDTDLICSNDLKERLPIEIIEYMNNNFKVEFIDDVRSANFYANGKTIMSNKPITLIIDGEYLANIYTAITESWFQKISVNIIAIYNEYDNINCEYLKRVIPNIINIYDEDIIKYEEKINKAIDEKYPSLINIKYQIYDKLNDYSEVCNQLEKILDSNEEIYLYNANINKEYNFIVKNILSKYKYGILSKYMGYIVGKNKKVLMCCTSDLLKIDINIFNNRYVDEKLKIIIYDIDNIIVNDNIEKWINNNNINIIKTNNVDVEKLRIFWNSENPEIMVIGGSK